ncbi:MAG: hypothetical protein CL555_08425 [Algoriphagus sp.]|nr:hypothetical protein [Algoriphagus sp.]
MTWLNAIIKTKPNGPQTQTEQHSCLSDRDHHHAGRCQQGRKKNAGGRHALGLEDDDSEVGGDIDLDRVDHGDLRHAGIGQRDELGDLPDGDAQGGEQLPGIGPPQGVDHNLAVVRADGAAGDVVAERGDRTDERAEICVRQRHEAEFPADVASCVGCGADDAKHVAARDVGRRVRARLFRHAPVAPFDDQQGETDGQQGNSRPRQPTNRLIQDEPAEKGRKEGRQAANGRDADYAGILDRLVERLPAPDSGENARGEEPHHRHTWCVRHRFERQADDQPYQRRK